MKNLLTLSLIIVCSCILSVNAQIKTPAASPSSTLMQTVGLTDITIEYSRPSVKGRTVFGDMLPYGTIWRAGANQATKITFSDDVTVEGQALTAGSYAILMVPGKTSFEVQFHPYVKSSWSSYSKATPAITVMAKVTALPMSIETLLYNFEALKDESATLEMVWEKTAVSMNIGAPCDEKVMKSIENTLAGPSAGDYNNAANYYANTGKDLGKALSMIQNATKAESPKFWHVRTEATILAKMGKYKDAIKAATKSMELAKAADYQEYVTMNQKSIAEWTKMMK